MSTFALFLLGLIVGAFGTLIGAGGGFLLVPVLLILYPHLEPEVVTAISLAVVFLNATSGSVAYGRMQKIDYRTGWIFAAAGSTGVTGFNMWSLFVAVIGAVVVLLIYHAIVRRPTV